MSESKELKFHSALDGLRYNYPNAVTTWGSCCTEGCSNGARGSGKCGVCYENEIADLTGSVEIASDIHEAIKDQSNAICKALDEINE